MIDAMYHSESGGVRKLFRRISTARGFPATTLLKTCIHGKQNRDVLNAGSPIIFPRGTALALTLMSVRNVAE